MARVNPGSHSVTYHSHVYPQVEQATPAFTFQRQSFTDLWSVVIPNPTEGRRLSWPGWLIPYIPRRYIRVTKRSPIAVLTGLDIK